MSQYAKKTEDNLYKNVLDLPQSVQIQNNTNTRHLGGYTADNDKKVTNRRLIRSGLPAFFLEDDIQLLLNQYNLKKIIDLRYAEEINNAPSLNDIPGIEYIQIDLHIDYNNLSGYPAENPIETDNTWINLYYQFGGTVESVLEAMAKIYITIATQEESQKAVREIFRILLDTEEGAILFHCSHGKDRTGTVAALILLALGVEQNICLSDYILTNEYQAGYIETEMKIIKEITEDPDVLEGTRILLSADLRLIENMFEAIRDQYISVGHYLLNTLMLTEDKINKLMMLYTTAGNSL